MKWMDLPCPELRSRRLLSILAAGILSATAAAQGTPLEQQLPLRVNCGDLNGHAAEEPGYVTMGPTSALGWAVLVPPPVATVHVAGLTTAGATPGPSDIFSIDPDDLAHTHKLTSLQLANPTQLLISGLGSRKPYRIRLELGAHSPWADIVGTQAVYVASTVSRRATVEESIGLNVWRTLARDVRCTAGYGSSTFASVVGSTVPVWALVHSDTGGNIILRFSSPNGDPQFLAGFELHAFEPLPVVYHHGASGALVTSNPALQLFASDFNANDFVSARQDLLNAPGMDPFLKGVALTQLVGWLDGSRDGQVDLIPEAVASLKLAHAPSHPAAAYLLSQLDQYQRAIDHLEARGYSDAFACPSEGGKGFMNPACAGQLQLEFGKGVTNPNAQAALRQLSGLCAPAVGATIVGDIQAWNAAPLQYAGWEPSPLAFAALKQFGVTIALADPFLDVSKLPSSSAIDPESTEFVQAFKDIFLTGPGTIGFGANGFGASEFPLDVELLLLAKYAELGKHPYLWDASLWNTTAGTAVLTDAQIEASWWGAYVAKPAADTAAPAWANDQRQFIKAYRGIIEYWLTSRLDGSELGGGWGDDIELLLQFYPSWCGRQDQADRRRLDVIDAMIAYGLDTPQYVSNGYFTGPISDVEHTAEYTANTFQATRAVFGHSARAIDTALGVTRHLVDDAQPFAGPTLAPKNRLHFKSYYMTSSGPDAVPAHMVDVLLNGRAMLPGVAMGFHAPIGAAHLLHQDLGAWAAAWRDDALDDPAASLGKPRGFFAPVQYPSNTFGNGTAWWSISGSASDTEFLDKTQIAYEVDLLRMAYRTSTAADRWRYLLPMVRLFKSVMAWEDQGKPVGSTGSEAWADKLVQGSPRFWALIAACTGDLETDPYLTVTDDPDVPGTSPYVDSALIAKLHGWLMTGLPGGINLPGAFNLALQYALRNIIPCSTGNTAKNSMPVSNAYLAANPFLRGAFPFLTRHVLHTDRVFINHANVLNHFAANVTGGDLQEGIAFRPAVRWITRLEAAPDISVSCNLRDLVETMYGAFAYNFGTSPVSVELQLDEGLVPGTYLVEVGPGAAKCDQFLSGVTSSQSVQKRGTGVKTPVLLQPGLNLVRITRQGAADAPAAGYDLAIDPPRLELYKKLSSIGGLPALLFKVHVVNAGATASPPATLNLFASVLLPDGSVLPVNAATPNEFLIWSTAVPSLAGTSDYSVASTDLQLGVFMNSIATTLLLSGLGIQLRAEVIAGPSEGDRLNNEMSRGWFANGTPLFGSG